MEQIQWLLSSITCGRNGRCLRGSSRRFIAAGGMGGGAELVLVEADEGRKAQRRSGAVMMTGEAVKGNGRVGHGGGRSRLVTPPGANWTGWNPPGRRAAWVRLERHMSTSEEGQPHHQLSHMSVLLV